jgi:hypothetical protein
VCHADNEGYYVPADFDEPLFVSDDTIAGSGMVGSSRRLLGELVTLAPAIGVGLESDGSLSDAEAARLDNRDDRFESEQTTWLTLYEACRVSVAHGNAVVFH